MKKNKGFTLVELLVVIVILGIITGLSIPLIRNLSASMEKKKYTTYNETLLSGAKLYNDSYSEDLFGHNENGCAYVTYEQLKDRNLLKDIEISDVSCNSDSTFVRILKIGDKYAYTPFLGCGKEKNGKANTIDTTLPIANHENEMKPEYCTGTEENNLEISALIGSDATEMNKKRKKTKLTITSATGINPKISLAVKWSTNKDDHDGTFEKVDFKVPGDQKDTIMSGNVISTKSGDLLTPAGITGEVFLIVRVDQLQDLYGSKWKNPDNSGSKYVSFGPFVIDNEPPTVPVITAYVKTSTADISSGGSLSKINSDTWSPKWILTVPSSTDNSGGTITYYYTTTGKTANAEDKKGSYRNINAEGKSYIKYKACDVAGNCSEYSDDFKVKLDRTKPTCGTATNASTTWTKDDRTIKQACVDKLGNDTSEASGCEKTSYEKKYNTSNKTDTITIKDKVGNTNTCTYDVYVDKDKPSCGKVTGSSTTWTKKEREIKQACTDSHSGCEKTSYENKYSSTKKTDTITIKDKVGNTNTCTYDVYVDTTNPTCGTVTGSSKDWTNSDRTITQACTDSDSGCEKTSYETKYSTSKKTDTITIKDTAGNTNTCTYDVYVDKDKPKCTKVTATAGGSNYKSGKLTCSDVVVTGTCSDTGGSGCKANPTKTVTSTQSVTLKVEDNAGNKTTCSSFSVKRGTKSATSACTCKKRSNCKTGSTCEAYGSWSSWKFYSCPEQTSSGNTKLPSNTNTSEYRAGGSWGGCNNAVERRTRSCTRYNTYSDSSCPCIEYNTCCHQ